MHYAGIDVSGDKLNPDVSGEKKVAITVCLRKTFTIRNATVRDHRPLHPAATS